MSRPDLLDERFEDIVRELRAGRVAARPELRARVREIAATAREPRPSLAERVAWRRVALVLTPVCLTAFVAVAMVQGLASSGGQQTAARAPKHLEVAVAKAPATPKVLSGAGGRFDNAESGVAASSVEPRAAGSPRASAPPAGNRSTDYRVQMHLRVRSTDDLSRETLRAMRIARRLGGYVVSVQYGAAKRGDATLLLRVPVAHMQRAILSFSGLGTIVSQHLSLTDLQNTYNRQVVLVGKLRTQIARIQRQLDAGGLSDVDRARLQDQLAYEQTDLAALVQSKQATHQRARLATAKLTLVTAKPKVHHHIAPLPPSRLDRALHQSGRILGKELVWALYASIVAAPLLVLALLGLAGSKTSRRRTERRLLARSASA